MGEWDVVSTKPIGEWDVVGTEPIAPQPSKVTTGVADVAGLAQAEARQGAMPTKVTTEQPEQGYGERLVGGWKERAERIGEAVTAPVTQPEYQKPALGLPFSPAVIGTRALSGLSEIVGGAYDIPMEAIKSTGEVAWEALPTKTQERLKHVKDVVSKSPVGQIGKRVIGEIGQKWEQFKEKSPEDARILESMMVLMPELKAGRYVTKEGKELSKTAISKVTTHIDEATQKRVASLPMPVKEKIIQKYDKDLIPIARSGYIGTTGIKAKTANELKTELGEKALANKVIINNADNLTLSSGSKIPQNMDDWAESISQSKDALWNKTIAPAIGATDETGFRVSMNQSINGLGKIIDDDVMKIRRPEVVEYAKKLRERLVEQEKKGGFTASQAQQFMAESNKEARKFFGVGNPETDTRLAMDIVVTNNIRNEFNRVVDLATDVGLKEEKAKYKALLSIEQDVNKARNREWKKLYGQNTPSYFDLGTDWGLLHSFITANPKGIIAAGGVKAIKKWQTMQMAPDTYVKTMFNQSEKIVKRQNRVLETIPKPVKEVPKQVGYTPRMGMEEVSGVRGVPAITPPTQRAIEYKPEFKGEPKGKLATPFEAGVSYGKVDNERLIKLLNQMDKAGTYATKKGEIRISGKRYKKDARTGIWYKAGGR